MRIFRLERRTISTILILQTNNILQKQTKITIIYISRWNDLKNQFEYRNGIYNITLVC